MTEIIKRTKMNYINLIAKALIVDNDLAWDNLDRNIEILFKQLLGLCV